ncbi:MAG: hypothetical protein JWM38_1149 [Sphingomonas bacterium]|jgi:hypothetical protein|nr:hypothetical protein [Sphingomonas bacterium]MDB5683080.1 hypothetical protein [Sphingomonas bacterium]MDB5717722.1 hypothetical protein [Sphingomonas bacterium]
MTLYVPTATMEPCTLAEAPRGSLFLPFGAPPLLVGEVDQHDLAIRLGGENPFTALAFSRDERSNVRGVSIGAALFDADPTTAYRGREATYAAGDLILATASTSIVGVHEDGTIFEVAVLGDPHRGPGAGFTSWRVGVIGRHDEFVTIYERPVHSRRNAANNNGLS